MLQAFPNCQANPLLVDPILRCSRSRARSGRVAIPVVIAAGVPARLHNFVRVAWKRPDGSFYLSNSAATNTTPPP